MREEKLIRYLCVAALPFLSGCVTSASLIAADGPRYTIAVDPISKGLRTEVDGVVYTGRYLQNHSIGVGFGQSFGMQPVAATSTFVAGDGSGRALLTAANGDYIECAFNASGTVVIGKCQSNKGRQFVLSTD